MATEKPAPLGERQGCCGLSEAHNPADARCALPGAQSKVWGHVDSLFRYPEMLLLQPVSVPVFSLLDNPPPKTKDSFPLTKVIGLILSCVLVTGNARTAKGYQVIVRRLA